jgi:HlyD family secretion protein
MKLRITGFFVSLFVVAAVGAAYFLGKSHGERPAAERYRTEAVTRGRIVQTVSANGTLNPVVLVNVGSQISGRIIRLYADFNDRVKAGQVLAELDSRIIRAQLQQARATLAGAQARLSLAEIEERRARRLAERHFLAQSELDKAVNAVQLARAEVERAKAQIQWDETNLYYTVIRSPVSGVVVSRNVDVGQTVAANFQTPTFFQIAQDIHEMQIDTHLAEADVGSVRVGQIATFSVDAYPERIFTGTVKQIRLNPAIQQNVVTYDVVIGVKNPEELFLPGMTAVVEIGVASREDALLVPQAALRFRPSDPDIPRPSRGGEKERTLYRLEGDRPVPLSIHTGIANSQQAEVVAGPLREGDRVVVEEALEVPTAGTASGFRVRLF